MRLGEKDEQRLRQWRAELEKVFPSVREGDTIVGLHEPGRGARFFYNGKPSGSVNDAELAAAFFAIWLDPRTKVDPTWPLLLDLRERGWQAADAWLNRRRGARSTGPARPASMTLEAQRRAG